MLTARPEGGNSVGKRACPRLGSRCPPNYAPLAKNAAGNVDVLRFPPAWIFTRDTLKSFGRSDRIVCSLVCGTRSANMLNTSSRCCYETLGCQKNTCSGAIIHSQKPCAEAHSHLNLKAPSAGSVNNYKSGTAVIECAGR